MRWIKIFSFLSVIFLIFPIYIHAADLSCWTNSATGGYSIGRRTDGYYYRVASSFTYDSAWTSIVGGTTALKRGAQTDNVPLRVEIQTDNSNKPSNTLADANGVASIASFTDATFVTKTWTLTAPISLTNGTKYWVVIKLPSESGLSGDDYYRNKEDDTTGTAGGAATLDTSTSVWTNTGAAYTQEFCLTGQDVASSTPETTSSITVIMNKSSAMSYLAVLLSLGAIIAVLTI